MAARRVLTVISMSGALMKAVALATAALIGAAAAQAQRSPAPGPTPGPTNPAPAETNPLAKPGADLVVNPTAEECQKGWQPDLKWTKQQFEEFCQQMKTSK